MTAWNVDSLKEHLIALMGEAEKRNGQRFAAQEEAVAAALQAAKEAVNKAEAAAEKRFDSVNEFRAQLTDQANTFIPRLEAEQRLGQQADRLAELQSRMDTKEGHSGGASKVNSGLMSVGALLIAAIAVVVSLFR
jgi:hypothetical protein